MVLSLSLGSVASQITVAVPPALPVAMTVGTMFALSRLKKQSVFCISPPRVNVAGKVNVCLFDKTGTLTTEGLDVLGVLPVLPSTAGFVFLTATPLSLLSPLALLFRLHLPSLCSLLCWTHCTVGYPCEPVPTATRTPPSRGQAVQFGQFCESIKDVPSPDFLTAMASCHGLTYVEGELIGDPLDSKIFEGTGWVC